MPPQAENLVGQRFGRLTVTRRVANVRCGKTQFVMFECACNCGGTATTRASSLKNGNTKSCGCWQKDSGRRTCRLRFTRKVPFRVPDEQWQLGYIAGLLDGEGTISNCAGTWRLFVTNTDERMIQWLRQFGGSIYSRQPRYREGMGATKRCYSWHLHSASDILTLLTAVRPFLIVKAAKADLAMIWCRELLARAERIAI